MRKNKIGLQYVEKLRECKYIKEKYCGHDISSFNFTRQAFWEGIWNDDTVKARGLYVNTETGNVVCRGYEKFFRDDELNKFDDNWMDKIEFPVNIYWKENGYLGLISVVNGELFITTKSSPDGQYAQRLREIIDECLTKKQKKYIRRFLKKNNCTLAVEVIDPVFDPHIIEYELVQIYGLDLIKNQWEFETKSYEDLARFCWRAGLEYKDLHVRIHTLEKLQEILSGLKKHQYEGFVCVCNNGFMFKIKTSYYTEWKMIRNRIGKMLKDGEMCKLDDLNDWQVEFCQWVYDHKEILMGMDASLIQMRNIWLGEKNGTRKYS